MELHARVRENIRERSLLERGARVLAGVSGGADSMALLHILHALAAEHDWSLAVAHFNHCLRGVESDTDETFVRGAAAKLNLAVHVEAGDVRAHAQSNGLSIEMAARELRHRFLLETARGLKIEKIALAHHADDQVETFWLRLLRGDVGAGVGGIRWKRAVGASGTVMVRPLLNIWKSELLSYLAKQNIPFREDASNQDPGFVRNRLRLEVLPLLEQFQPALRDVSLRAAEVFGAEKSFLEGEAQRWLSERKIAFGELHIALQREIIRSQLLAMGIKPTFEWIEHLRSHAEVPLPVAPSVQVTRTDAGEMVRREVSETSFVESEACAQIDTEGGIRFGGVEFGWRMVAAREAPCPGVEFFDAEAVGGTVRLRYWRAGDRFQPIGFEHEAKLQDQFTNQKIDAVEKRRRIVATTESGKIFWVEGLRISEEHKVRAETRQILRWAWRRQG